MDGALPWSLLYTLEAAFSAIGTIILVVIINPWVLAAVVPVCRARLGMNGKLTQGRKSGWRADTGRCIDHNTGNKHDGHGLELDADGRGVYVPTARLSLDIQGGQAPGGHRIQPGHGAGVRDLARYCVPRPPPVHAVSLGAAISRHYTDLNLIWVPMTYTGAKVRPFCTVLGVLKNPIKIFRKTGY
jgi:hypothetical protein